MTMIWGKGGDTEGVKNSSGHEACPCAKFQKRHEVSAASFTAKGVGGTVAEVGASYLPSWLLPLQQSLGRSGNQMPVYSTELISAPGGMRLPGTSYSRMLTKWV